MSKRAEAPVNDPLLSAIRTVERRDRDGHAMVELVTDDTVRGRQSVGARKTAESLSWENELDELDAIYRDIIGANGENSRVA
jgi:hypothetical protein